MDEKAHNKIQRNRGLQFVVRSGRSLNEIVEMNDIFYDYHRRRRHDPELLEPRHFAASCTYFGPDTTS